MKLFEGARLRSAFETLLGSSATPYGYTLTIWSSGAVTRHFRGSPNIGDIFLFMAGALLAFTLLSILGQRLVKSAKPLSPSTLDWSGMFHWIAAGAALGAVALLAQIDSWVSWPLASFVSTGLYLCLATLQLAVAARHTQPG